MEKKFYVYADYTPDGTPFYVGKGDESRVKTSKRNRKHGFVAAKHGRVREVMLETFDEQAAFELEVKLVAEHKLNCKRYPENPYACNFTDGGDGPAGYRHTDEAKQAMSEKRRGVKRGPASDEARSNQSKARLAGLASGKIKTWNEGVPASENVKKMLQTARLGVAHTDVARAKITAAQIGRIMRNETACRKTMEDIYLIAERITNGETQVSIQREYGVSKSFLYQQLKKLANEKGV